jgi:hypothetical protein
VVGLNPDFKIAPLSREQNAARCKYLLGGSQEYVKGQGVGWLCDAMLIFEFRPDRFECGPKACKSSVFGIG